MIDLIYKTLQTIVSKDNSGYLSPTEFNVLANNVQEDIFRGYFEDENRDKNRENKGLTNKGYSNLDFNERQRINQFSAISTLTGAGGTFTLPEDLYVIEDDGIISNVSPNNVIEEIERQSIGYVSNSLSAPSVVYPVYERYANTIVVHPNTIDSITLRYLRKPRKPQWTYFVLPNGSEVFDPSNPSFQDFE